MIVLLDENVHRDIGKHFTNCGCLVRSDAGSAEAGLDDEALFRRVREEKSLFVKFDQAFASTRNFPPNQTGGVLVLRTRGADVDQVIALVTDFLTRHPPDSLKGRTVVLSRHKARFLR